MVSSLRFSPTSGPFLLPLLFFFFFFLLLLNNGEPIPFSIPSIHDASLAKKVKMRKQAHEPVRA